MLAAIYAFIYIKAFRTIKKSRRYEYRREQFFIRFPSSRKYYRKNFFTLVLTTGSPITGYFAVWKLFN